MLILRLLSEGGPNTDLASILWIEFGFMFLMIVVGWLVSRRKGH